MVTEVVAVRRPTRPAVSAASIVSESGFEKSIPVAGIGNITESLIDREPPAPKLSTAANAPDRKKRRRRNGVGLSTL
jgi:hypothetical protein